ncbi:flagellar brake protein [Lachnospiraceae bacterium ZAX-1]
MVKEVLKAGDKIEIRILQQSDKIYRSTIYDILDNDEVEIGMPMEKGKMAVLSLNLLYELEFFGENGVYRCTAQVIERYKRDNLYALRIELKSQLKKIQRREYYRFECAVDMDYMMITQEEAEMPIEKVEAHHRHDYPEDAIKHAVALDLSGGGIRFTSDELEERSGCVFVKMALKNETMDRQFQMVGRLLRSKRLETDREKYEHRTQFLQIDARTREQIIKYIFDEERKNRNRGKGR